MAYKRISAMYFMADSKKDLVDLPESRMGAECFVIEEACEYKCTSDGKWIKQTVSSGPVVTPDGSIDLSGYATEEYVDNAIANIDIPEVDLTDYAKKNEIPDVSEFTTKEEVQELIDAIEMPEGSSNMVALTEEEVLNICKF